MSSTAIDPKKASIEELDLRGPVSKTDKKLLAERKKLEEQKRKPHDSAFTGWKEVGGWERGDILSYEEEIIDLLTKSTFLDEYLPEVAYGDWYHTVAIVILGGFLSWLLGRFRFSLGPVFFITVASAIYYRSSIRKYRMSIRLQAQREFSVNHIEDDFESMDWLNVFLDRYWRFIEPTAAQMVCDQANAIMAGLPIPAFVKQVWIHTFTLGTKAPRIDKVRTLDRTDDDVTVMDWWVSLNPNALEDTTSKQLKNYVNQSIIVKAKLFGLTIPFAVSNVAFQVKVRVRLRMMQNFPHIQTVNVSLMEAPHFDFIAKPFGGDSIFSFEVLNIPGLFMTINELVKKFAGPMVFDPLSFQLNLEQLLNGNGLDGALGILQVNVKHAKGLKAADTFNNTIDPYLTFGFGSEVLAKSKVIPDTMDPVWNEKINVMLKSSSEPLNITLYDENESDGRKDKMMGCVLYDLEEIMLKGEIRNINLPILRNNREAGEVSIDLKLMKTLQGFKLPDGSYSPPPDLNTGVVVLKLLGARAYNEDDKKPGNVFAEVLVDKELKLTSGLVKKSKEASWNLTHDQIVYNRSKCKVRVILRDSAKKLVGSATFKLTDIIDASYVGNEWLSLTKGLGEVRLTCNWSSVAMTDVPGAMGYTEPFGVVRFNIGKAENLINLEKIGVIDPYIRIMINGIQRGRTLTRDSTTNPVYNQSIYVPIASPNQRVTIEAMDVQRSTPDRTLGSFQVRLNEFIEFNDNGDPIESSGETKEGRLVHPKRGAKGSVSYSMSFFPTLPVMTPDDILEKKNIEKAKAAGEKKELSKEEQTQEKEEEEELEDAKPKLDLPLSKVQDYSCGVCVFTLLEGQFSKDGYLQVFFDKEGYPEYVSPKLSSRNNRINSTGEALVKELKYSMVTLRLSEKKNSNFLQKALAEVTMPTMELLNKTYDQPQVVNLSNGVSVKLQTRWTPVLMETLPAQDSIGNAGSLRLRVIKASGLPAADSNGKSDPFTKVYLNGDDVMKTKTIKKTLDPEWNEEEEFEVDNRVNSVLRFKVSDWDIGLEQDDKLGEVSVNLSEIDPFLEGVQESKLQLIDDDGQPAGDLYVAFEFKPFYVTVLSADKQLPNVAGSAVDGAGKLLGTGLDGTGKVLGGAGKVGGKVIGTATNLFKKKK
ncbi:hypothetical protein OGAPHI_002155 [Ogataea philodendri]|uniref:Tricalbin n=1 Tax=Ogataea philodendri TaxID=1378263 RepID=A0A9P8T718_9ASCO|nr:uncharacterized protein OGAPHI_002155 [Ogataea philodendri]KAH3668401.1 hypothetical protein OGAPHI_002155 [Ogataea philodendri]